MKFTPRLATASLLAATTAAASRVCQQNHLQADVYYLAPAPVVYQNRNNLTFSPTSYTLISGKHDAILVDSPALTAQGHALSDWITATIPNKTLQAIYVTHGHGDHFFTANVIRQAHPHARVLATAGTAQHMAQQYTTPLWDALFPGGQVDHGPVVPEILRASDTIDLEGHVLRIVEVGQGDTYSSTVLHVPDLDLVVGGDVVYGDCHQLLVEDDTSELRALWLASLDKVAALQPRAVVPGHQTRDNGFSPQHIEDTKGYIRFYERALAQAKTWQELEASLLARYPERDGRFGALWSAQAAFNASF